MAPSVTLARRRGPRAAAAGRVEDWGADEASTARPAARARGRAPAALTEAPTAEDSLVAEVVDTPEPREVVSDGRRTIRINGRPGEVSRDRAVHRPPLAAGARR